MKKDYQRKSVLAGYISSLLAEKRSMGFSYEFEEYILNVFDDYCVKHGLEDPEYDREFLKDWLCRHGNEGDSYHSQRISFVRQLSLYLNSLGIPAYIPIENVKKCRNIPHFLNREERIAFFRALDENRPQIPATYALRMWNEYRVIFRLIYSCGLRNSEAAGLKAENVHLSNGYITIIHSKGDKDRLVYLADDMVELMRDYWKYLNHVLGFVPVWFFPSRDPALHVCKTTLDYKFNRIWNLTAHSNNGKKKPTLHALRHSYVVDRINSWILEGITFDQMIPYLCRYLGHTDFDETLYYYHLNEEANWIIRRNDRTVGNVLPEEDKYGS